MKNKITKLTLAAVLGFVALSFTTIDIVLKEIKIEKSKVVWKGYKVTGSHEGTINLKSGNLEFSNDKLSGGNFVIDMSTITNTDQEGEYKGKLEGHLKSDDFFGVEKFPSAKLVFTKVKATGKESYKIQGDLTIKGITNPVTFEMSIEGNTAQANLKIDRSKFDIRYGSTSFYDDLKDKAIYDEFDLTTELEF